MSSPGLAFPAPARGWVLVAFLVAAYAVSFVDRQILSLLVRDLKQDLAITDSQIGLLQGPAFGIFYAVMGLPFGWLADRRSRTRLIAIGMLLWTVMTLLGGLSNSFWMLFLTRMGVGVGEAALVPAAVSLLADSFAPRRRALPLAVFTAGISVGAGLALVIGGGLVAFAREGATALPLVGHWFAGRSPWQTVLILAGLGGVPLALAILCLPEPARRLSERQVGPADRLFTYLGAQRRVFLPLLAGTSLLYLFSNAFSAWLPTLFVRGFGWEPAMIGVRLGGLILLGALAGTLSSGTVATALVRRGHPDGALRTMIVGATLLAPAALLGPLAGSAAVAQAALLLIYFATALCFGVATASLVAATPASLRGQVVALYLLLGNLVGLGLGPPAVGLIVEQLLGDPRRIGAALSLVALCTVPLGALLLGLARRPYRPLAAATLG